MLACRFSRQRLGQVLNETTAAQIGEQLGAALVNDPKSDGFVLARLRRDQIPGNAADVKDDGRAMILQICAATGLPEFMFGDASNANR